MGLPVTPVLSSSSPPQGGQTCLRRKGRENQGPNWLMLDHFGMSAEAVFLLGEPAQFSKEGQSAGPFSGGCVHL